MAATVTYATIDGELVYENRGGVETYYVPDTQGSLIECHDATGAITYEAWYWPYGEVRKLTGSKANSWGYIGLLGYMFDSGQFLCVRARYYRPNLARWQTVDPLWPRDTAYCYCGTLPTFKVDPAGLGWLDIWKRWREFFGACIANGVIATFFGYLSSAGELPDGVFLCVAIGSCLGALAALALIIMYPELPDCIAQIIGILAWTLGNLLCPFARHLAKPCAKQRNPWCYLVDFVTGALSGCFARPSDINSGFEDTIASIVGQFGGNVGGGACDALSG